MVVLVAVLVVVFSGGFSGGFSCGSVVFWVAHNPAGMHLPWFVEWVCGCAKVLVDVARRCRIWRAKANVAEAG